MVGENGGGEGTSFLVGGWEIREILLAIDLCSESSTLLMRLYGQFKEKDPEAVNR